MIRKGRVALYAIYYRKKRLTKPGTEYEARMDLLRLNSLFLHLEIREITQRRGRGALERK